MNIYTASMGYTGTDKLDITAKSSSCAYGKMFAPEWHMVRGLRSGEIDEDKYERMYRALMNERFKYHSPHMEQWVKIDQTRTLVCYCKPGAFCHRIIAAEGLEKIGGVYKGERNIRSEMSHNITTPGDMLEIKQGILVHQVNCQGVMGAGIAKAIADKWPFVKEAYTAVCRKHGRGMLGRVHVITIDNGLYVANLFGQDRYGRDKRYTNYMALHKGLRSLANWRSVTEGMSNDPIRAYFPHKMSCSNAGGDWYLVYKKIKNMFSDATIIRK